MKTFIIPGDPIPLLRARPSFAQRKVYDSQKNLKVVAMHHIQRQQGSDIILKDLPLHLEITLFMPIPASTPQKHKLDMIDVYHKVRPDSSNLLKFVEDICNKAAYDDDCAIAKITLEKIYSDNPRTEFKLSVLPRKRVKVA